MIKINCKWNDNGAWCKNKKVKRNLFGLGARCCIEYDTNKVCQLKEPHLLPKKLPLRPPLRKKFKTININISDKFKAKMGEKIVNKLDLQVCYDEHVDVLYVSFGDSRPSISTEANDGNLVRLDLYTNEITGITIIDFKNRYMSNP
ncbi:MAG: DUF2283 domain-containing protein [Patescibacteria group bacterium]|nr:DUF2283 domain-containing protein [Patescibacteria group bacterium]